MNTMENSMMSLWQTMLQLHRTFKVVLMGAFLAVGLAACGGSDSPAPTSPVAPFTPVTVVQNQTATQNSYTSVASLPGNNTVGGYEFGAPQPPNWWAGVGTDSVYRGIGVATTDTGAGVGVYVAGAGTTTWNINGASSVTVGLGTNLECVGICKATIILVNDPGTQCKATSNNPMTMVRGGVNTGLGINTGAGTATTTASTYSQTLTAANWTVTGCATNTMASFLSLPLKEVHAQLLQANMQFSVGAGPQYANGLNLGGISFQ